MRTLESSPEGVVHGPCWATPEGTSVLGGLDCVVAKVPGNAILLEKPNFLQRAFQCPHRQKPFVSVSSEYSSQRKSVLFHPEVNADEHRTAQKRARRPKILWVLSSET